MDRRERTNSLLVTIRAALQAFRASLWTAIPAYVVSYDAVKMTVVAQPTIMAQVRSPDLPDNSQWLNVKMPTCPDCPVVFPGGGDFSLTFPLAAGDEGLLVFASKCIDAWWQQSGVQPQAAIMPDFLSDGFFIPRCWSQPNKPTGVSTTTAQLRSKDGTTYVEIAAGKIVNVVAPGGITIDGPMRFGLGGSNVIFTSLPISAVGLPSGALWRNGTAVMVVP